MKHGKHGKTKAAKYGGTEVMLGRRVIRHSAANLELGPPLYATLLDEAKRQVKKAQDEVSSGKGGEGGAELGKMLGEWLKGPSHARAPETEAGYQAYRAGERSR